MPISNGANTWPRQYWNKPLPKNRDPRVVVIDRPYEPPVIHREPTPPPKIVYVDRPRSPQITYVTRPVTPPPPPPPPRQVTIVRQSPPPQQVIVRQRSPSPVQTVYVERRSPTPKPIIVQQKTPSPQPRVIISRPASPGVTYVTRPPSIHDQVNYITQTTPELQRRQPSPPRYTYITEPQQPHQPVTYVQRVQSSRRPTVVYATKAPQQVVRPPPSRTVYIQPQPPQQTVLMQPPPPQVEPQYAYVPANSRGGGGYVDPNAVYRTYYGNDVPPSAFGNNQSSCAVM